MLNVRLAEPVDLASVIKFDAFPSDRVIEIIDHRMLVIDVDGETQGYASWQKNGCIGMDYVNKLVVSDAYRRRGLAKYLIGDSARSCMVESSSPRQAATLQPFGCCTVQCGREQAR